MKLFLPFAKAKKLERENKDLSLIVELYENDESYC